MALREVLSGPEEWDKENHWGWYAEAILSEAARNDPRLNYLADDFVVSLLDLVEQAADEIERLRWLLNGGGLCSKPLDADIAAIVHKNLDSLYVEDPPAIDAAMEGNE